MRQRFAQTGTIGLVHDMSEGPTRASLEASNAGASGFSHLQAHDRGAARISGDLVRHRDLIQSKIVRLAVIKDALLADFEMLAKDHRHGDVAGRAVKRFVELSNRQQRLRDRLESLLS